MFVRMKQKTNHWQHKAPFSYPRPNNFLDTNKLKMEILEG